LGTPASSSTPTTGSAGSLSCKRPAPSPAPISFGRRTLKLVDAQRADSPRPAMSAC
jgi:hypothetical protein